MPFAYKKIISILSLSYGIDEQNMTAFRGRIQHMQRLKFPPGVNTGKGKPTPYTWRELFLLGLAFECLEIGSTPERCVAEITKSEDQLLESLASVILFDEEIHDPDHIRCLVYLDLSALVSLRSERNQQEKIAILSPSESSQLFFGRSDSRIQSPYTVVDLRQFVDGLVSSVASVFEMEKADIMQDIIRWVDPSRQALNRLANSP